MVEKNFEIEDMSKVSELFGSFDFNIKLVEHELDVQVINRGSTLKIMGSEGNVTAAYEAIGAMMNILKNGEALTEQGIRYCIAMAKEGSASGIVSLNGDFVCITSKGKPIKAKTLGQKEYIKAIKPLPSTAKTYPMQTSFITTTTLQKSFISTRERAIPQNASTLLKSQPQDTI